MSGIDIQEFFMKSIFVNLLCCQQLIDKLTLIVIRVLKKHLNIGFLIQNNYNFIGIYVFQFHLFMFFEFATIHCCQFFLQFLESGLLVIF